MTKNTIIRPTDGTDAAETRVEGNRHVVHDRLLDDCRAECDRLRLLLQEAGDVIGYYETTKEGFGCQVPDGEKVLARIKAETGETT